MILYSGPLSLFSGKVRIALDEKGVAHELVSVPFGPAGYEPKHPRVTAVNPKQQVPVLVDGDLELYDSTLILEYLEDRHPTPPLYPRDPAARARCRLLELEADEVLFPHVLELIREVFYQPDAAARDGARIAAARRAIAAHADRLEQRVRDGRHLCGDFTVADVGYFMTLTFAAGLGTPLGDAHPRLRAWYARLAERPSIQRELGRLLAAQQALAS